MTVLTHTFPTLCPEIKHTNFQPLQRGRFPSPTRVAGLSVPSNGMRLGNARQPHTDDRPPPLSVPSSRVAPLQREARGHHAPRVDLSVPSTWVGPRQHTSAWRVFSQFVFQSPPPGSRLGNLARSITSLLTNHYSGTFKQGHFPWKFPRNIPWIEKTSCTWRADVTR